jgi:hypothetical protein
MRIILNRWQIIPAVVLLALAAGPASRRANADEWNKRTVLTVNQPIEVADTVLQPGKYVLQLPNGNSDRHVVLVYNGDQTHLIETVVTIPAERLGVRGKTQSSYWETPPGTAKALRDWYYPGDNFGQEFPYPKHPQQLAMVEKQANSSQTTSAAAVAPAQPAAPAAPPPAEQSPSNAANTSQAAPPPAPPAPPVTENEQAPAPAPAAASTAQTPPPAQTAPAPKELPKTASPYPLVGISGAMLLAVSGLLRLKRAGAR